MCASRVVSAEPLQEARARLSIWLTETDPKWLPDARNKTLRFTATILAFVKGDWAPAKREGQKRKITFSLSEVSKEKGVCMNFPKDANTNPDLFFACSCPECFTNQNPKMTSFDFAEDSTSGRPCVERITAAGDNPRHRHHYQKATTKNPEFSATAVVRCEDFGAWGVLTATAEDCEVASRPITKKPANKVAIPVDENNNRIADSADQDKDGRGKPAKPADDNDSLPVGNRYKGDGFTNYEEYRGFIVKDEGGGDGALKHIRTDTAKKDVFVCNAENLDLSLFQSASELDVHVITDPDLFNGASNDVDGGPTGKTQIVNFNHGHANGGEQHGLRLVSDNTIAQNYGRTKCILRIPVTPGTTNRVTVNVHNCRQETEPSNRESRTVAHELGHSIGMFHHGEKDPKHNHPVPSPEDPDVDVQRHSEYLGGQTSGAANCIMRYVNTVYMWCHPQTLVYSSHCVHNIPRVPSTGLLPSDSYCDSPKATGENLDRRCRNDADSNAEGLRRRGNCKSQLRVKDW